MTGTIAKLTDKTFGNYEYDYIILAGGFIIGIVFIIITASIDNTINKLINTLKN